MAHNLILELRLTAKNISDLAVDLDYKMEIAEEFQSRFIDNIKIWTDSYLLTPDEEVKMDPWPDASNIYMPMNRVGTDGLLAQFHDAMLSDSPFMKVRGVTDAASQDAEDLSLYYGEFYYRKQIPFRELASDYLWDTLVGGTAVMKNWVDRSETVRRYLHQKTRNKRGRPTGAQGAFEFQGETVPAESRLETVIEEELFIEETRNIQMGSQSIERIFVPPTAGPSMQFPECPWYFEETMLTWSQLKSREVSMGYVGVDDKLKSELVPLALDKQSEAVAENMGLSFQQNEPQIRVLEYYMRVALPAEVKRAIRAGRIEKLKGNDVKKQEFMDDDGWEEEVVITYLPRQRRVLRIVPLDRVRVDGKRPHVDMRFNRIPRFWYGQGVPATAMGMQKGMNSFMNQMVDYGTLQNLPWLLFNPMEMGDLPERMFLEPGAMIPVADPGAVHSHRFQGDASFWISALQILQGQGERLFSISDFTQGAAPTRPNAPDTARATLALIANAQLAFDYKTSQMTESFINVFEQNHAQHRLHQREPVKFNFFDRETGALRSKTIAPSAFQQPVEFQFILNPSRSSEQQVNQTLFTLLAEPLMMASGGDPRVLRPMAEDIWTSHGKQNFDEIWPKDLAPQIAGPAPPSPGQQPAGAVPSQQPASTPVAPAGLPAPAPPAPAPVVPQAPPGPVSATSENLAENPDFSLDELFDQQKSQRDVHLTPKEEGATLANKGQATPIN